MEFEEVGLMLVFSIIGVFVSFALSLYYTLFLKRIKEQRIKTPLQDNIKNLIQKLNEARELQSTIDAQIEGQLITTEKMSEKKSYLKQEVKRLKELKNLSQKQVEAVGSIIKKEMDVVSRKSFYKNVWFSVLMFFIGVIVVIIIQLVL